MRCGVKMQRDKDNAWGEFAFGGDVGCAEVSGEGEGVLDFDALEGEFCDAQCVLECGSQIRVFISIHSRWRIWNMNMGDCERKK